MEQIRSFNRLQTGYVSCVVSEGNIETLRYFQFTQGELNDGDRIPCYLKRRSDGKCELISLANPDAQSILIDDDNGSFYDAYVPDIDTCNLNIFQK